MSMQVEFEREEDGRWMPRFQLFIYGRLTECAESKY